MSLSEPLRPLAAAILLALMPALAACSSFQPVYSGRLAQQPALELAYARPANRLEQIIYQELSLRLGSSTSPSAPLVAVTASASSTTPFLSATDSPSKPYRATVTASLTITPRDGVDTAPIRLTRSATAQYTTNSQVLADRSAEIEAQERAARAAAESLRLAVLAALARG